MMIFPSLYLKSKPSNAPKKFRNNFFDMFLSAKNKKLDSVILGDNEIKGLQHINYHTNNKREKGLQVCIMISLWIKKWANAAE
jgi:hypothetical protein